jgi:hypothetical protein
MRLLRVAIVLLCLSLMSCGGGDDVARPAVKGVAQILAGNVDQVDNAAAAQRAGVSVDVVQQAKTEWQAGQSGLVTRLDQAVGTFTEEEYKRVLDAACFASDSYQFVTADSYEDREKIVRSQGKSPQARTTAVVSLAEDLVKMENGSDREKAAASLLCLGVNLRYG